MTKLNIDCLDLIFNKLQDKNSLHSCLLVNNVWCNVAVPILWKKYFMNTIHYNKINNTIISLLPSSSRQLLSDNEIKLPSTIFLRPPLFNYIGFCQIPNHVKIHKIINMVIGQDNNSYKRNLLEKEIYKLFISQCKNITIFRWETSQPLSLFPGASTCFSQLYSLQINVYLVTPDSLYGMAQICKDLNKLVIYNCFQDLPGLISLIDAQRNLKRVNIAYSHVDNIKKGSCKEFGKALARKSSTINALHLFSVSIIPPSFLTSLINLRILSVYFNENYDDITERINEFQQYLAIVEFPCLRVLEICDLPCFKEISLLIEKTKGDVSIVDVRSYSKSYINKVDAKNVRMLIKAIANNCPKIIYLFLTHLELEHFIHIKLLLLNCKNLESIRFDGSNFVERENDNNIGNELLDILTKFSPKSLTNITIDGDWNYSIDSLKRFFESCRGRTLDSFHIIRSITEEYKAIVLEYMNEGVIKISNLKYEDLVV